MGRPHIPHHGKQAIPRKPRTRSRLGLRQRSRTTRSRKISLRVKTKSVRAGNTSLALTHTESGPCRAEDIPEGSTIRVTDWFTPLHKLRGAPMAGSLGWKSLIEFVPEEGGRLRSCCCIEGPRFALRPCALAKMTAPVRWLSRARNSNGTSPYLASRSLTLLVLMMHEMRHGLCLYARNKFALGA